MQALQTKYEYAKVVGLSRIELRSLERALNMSEGYVLNFTNLTFTDFLIDNFKIDLEDDQFLKYGESKAKRLRAGFTILGRDFFLKFLNLVKINWDSVRPIRYNVNNEEVPEIINKILDKERSIGHSESANAIGAHLSHSDKDFLTVTNEVKKAIENGTFVEAIDRLHTFMTWYLRNKCELYSIEVQKGQPLHSLMGKLNKELDSRNLIDSEMGKLILKSSANWLEKFNYVRNNNSLAHPNKLLNSNEALLICTSICSLVKFIDSIELESKSSDSNIPSNDIPF